MQHTTTPQLIKRVKLNLFKLAADSRWRNSFLLAATSLLVIVDISLQRPILLVLVLLGGAIALAVRDFGKAVLTARRWHILLQVLLVFYAAGIAWSQFEPTADAAFFSAACGWMTTTFATAFQAGGAGPANVQPIALIFDALRAVLLLYAGISLVSVVQALRQDEEWLTVARTPLAVLVCVVLADILTSLIVPNAAGAGGNAGNGC